MRAGSREGVSVLGTETRRRRIALSEKDHSSQFSEAWTGGYYEGDPMDPMGVSTYGVYGYNSSLFTVYLACIRAYVGRETVALEIGPGRGAWSKVILARNCKRLYAVDAAPAEHTRFWEYVGRNERATYIVANDFDLAEIPDGSIDFFFSFGVFCHLRPEMCESYIRSLARKMKPGANGFLMCADFDKYNRCLDAADRSSLKRFFDYQRRKVWMPVRLAYSVTWNLFRPKMDLSRVSKSWEKNLCDAEGRTSWYHWGVENACAALLKAGFEVVDPDIGAVSRDPITHFRKPQPSVPL
jgi:methyltransferase family protein